MARDPFRAAVDRLRHHLRTRPAAPVRTLDDTPHPVTRALGLVAVVVLGAWLGLLIVGSVRTPVGPMDTDMTLRPSLSGGTKINVSPLGALELDSHTAPIRLDVDVDRLDPVRSQALVKHPERLSGLQDEVTNDVVSGTRELAVRSCVAVVSGATALGRPSPPGGARGCRPRQLQPLVEPQPSQM